MRKNFLKRVFIFLLLITASWAARAQQVRVLKFQELQTIRENPADTLYVVNFWATWCKPCIKELPYFEHANQTYKAQPVKVILVSLDSRVDLQNRVLPFVKKRNLQSKLYLLDEPDANSWIDKLEPQWSGAIPATIFFNNRRQVYYFAEKEFQQTELLKLIAELKTPK